jgi:hypothetical protein
VLAALCIHWTGNHSHIDCPYPDHGGEADWRWHQTKARAFCSCIGRRPGERGAHSIFDVVSTMEKIDFETAKIRVADILGRTDLIREKGGGQEHCGMTAEALLNPPVEKRDDSLPRNYLAHRLGVSEAEVPLPCTTTVGWTALHYYDPPTPKGKPVFVGYFACAVFEMADPDGRRHALRIYLAPGGVGKANVGTRADGRAREPKKLAKAIAGDSTNGRAVIWGNPVTASLIIVCEGVETAEAVALAFKAEAEAGTLLVAAAIHANGVEAFDPWPRAEGIIVAGDRDEAPKPSGQPPSRQGEHAARALCLRHHSAMSTAIALPGQPGEKVDWLDILRRDGLEAVRNGIEGAVSFVPTEAELQQHEQRVERQREIDEAVKTYPLPELETVQLEYRHTASGRLRVHRFDGVKQDIAQWTLITTPFGIIARLRFADQGDASGLRVVVQGMEGRPRLLDFKRADLARQGAQDIRSVLFEAGLRTEQNGELTVVNVLKGAEPATEITIVSRPGWHWLKDCAYPIFVTPAGKIIGADDVTTLELSVNTRLCPSVARAGTLDEWRDSTAVAIETVDCPHWTLGVIAGFAGLLIDLTGLDTCGISLSGMSSSGKTLAQKLAVSVWSSPRAGVGGLFRTVRSTENAIEALAQDSSGTLLSLDELSHADGRVIGRMIYSIASGVGKSHMRPDATLRGTYAWSTFIILSGEHSLEEKVRRDGGKWLPGMAVRIADVDVTGVNRAVDQARIDQIKGISSHYGHAGPAFVRALITEAMHQEPEALRDRILTAGRQLAGESADSALVRAATTFGLLAVAGQLAIHFGLLTAQPGQINEAVRWAWTQFCASSDALALDPERQAVDHIRGWLAERWDVTVKATSGQTGHGGRETVAWYDDDIVYVPTKRLAEAAGDALKERHIAKMLADKGLLAKRHSEKRLAVQWVPNVGPVQCYALRRDVFGRTNRDRDPAMGPRAVNE